MHFCDDKTLYSTVGNKIKEIRENNHLTQQQLFEEVGISISYLSKIEAAKCDMSSPFNIKSIGKRFGR